MATEVDLLPVRETFKTKFGVGDERIGYDPNSGFVTIDNQKIFKPPTNREGTTYAGEDVFNSATGQINTLNNAYKLQQQVLNPQQQANPFDQRFNDLLNTLSGRVQNPAVIDRNAVYQSPQYAAQQAQAQQAAGRSIRAAQEALGDSGFAQSTRLSDRAQGIQNDASQFLETQVVPQIIQQMQAQEDQKTAGLMGLLSVLGQQQGLYDDRANSQFDRAASVLEFLTGRQDRAEDTAFRNDQEDYRRQRDQVADQRLAEEKTYRANRDSVADQQWWAEYERRGQEFAAQQGLQWAQLNQREKERLSDEAWKEKEFNLRQQELDQQKTTKRKTEFDDEKRGLLAGLRSGQLNPADALQQIDDDTKFGFYTADEAAELKQLVSTIAPTVTKPAELTEEQKKELPSDKEIDRIWETEGKPNNYPVLDFRSWYKDPNGRSAGVTFERWRQLYGPRLQ